MALDDRQILNIISEELQQSAGGNENDMIDSNRQAALATYLGQPDGREVEGRSSIISTDVADAIEWIMPEIVKAFTQNNEVVTFDSEFDGDELQAELESQYVYDILMKDNNGFVIIHQFVKDCLMQKNGFLKVFYEKDDVESVEYYTGITEVEVNLVVAEEGIELLQMTDYEEEGVPLFDIKVKRTTVEGGIKVMSVPPEEFRVNKMHNSIDLSDARFTAHVVLKTTGDLIKAGHSKELIDSIPTSQVYEDDREYRFYMQGETVYPDRDINSDPSLRTVEISECFMHTDINEDGVAEMMKIEVTGGDNPDVILGMEPVDSNPFISATAILMSHKLFGLSIYDRLKQIQEQKTTLWRNIFDNMYLQNNQRTIVVEGQVNLDDVMTSRPGGLIRVKRPDAVVPFLTPPLSGDSYKMMDYLDQVRAGRSGVTPEGPVTDSMIGDRVGSEGIEKMMSQKEELVGLMIRVIAETGIKPLCYKIRNEVIKHQDVVKDYKFRGQWVQVDPRQWRKRSRTTVRVGTGSGNRQQQSQAITQLIMIQEKILANPGQALLTENHVYQTLNDFAKFSGLAGAGKYFQDPASPEGQKQRKAADEKAQKKEQMEIQERQALAKAQSDVAQAELGKADAAAKSVAFKNDAEQIKHQLTLMEQTTDAEIDMLKQQLAEAEAVISAEEKTEELAFKYWEAKLRYETQEKQIEAQAKAARENNSESRSD